MLVASLVLSSLCSDDNPTKNRTDIVGITRWETLTHTYKTTQKLVEKESCFYANYTSICLNFTRNKNK